MKNALLILSLLASSQAFADAKSLKVFNALLAGGAVAEPGMSQLHVGVDNVACTTGYCTMQDISAADGQGAPLTIEGQAAADLMDALELGSTPEFDPYGKFEVQFDSIRCHQVQDGVSDGSEEERTSCDIDPGYN